MSQTSSKRSVKEIQEEYSQLCAKAGHLQYSIFSLKKDLEMLNDTLRDLNIEAANSNSREAAESAKQEAAKIAAQPETEVAPPAEVSEGA